MFASRTPHDLNHNHAQHGAPNPILIAMRSDMARLRVTLNRRVPYQAGWRDGYPYKPTWAEHYLSFLATDDPVVPRIGFTLATLPSREQIAHARKVLSRLARIA